MRALVVTPGEANTARVMEVPDPTPREGEVLVRGVRLGLCGTDHEIDQGLYGTAPPGSPYLVLGHESFGRVARGTAELAEGTHVVGMVRRGDGCPNCARGEQDMCLWGGYTERGIGGLHGFGSEWWAERPEYLVRIPEPLAPIGVLLEPTSVVEKAIRTVFVAQERLYWEPRRAIIAGAGPIGIMAAVVLRLRNVAVTVFERTEKPGRRALLADIGAGYAATGVTPLAEIASGIGAIDLALEATGNASVGFALLEHLGTNGALALTSVTGGDARAELPIAKLNQAVVLGNKLVLGSVNANRIDFENGVRDLQEAARRWPSFLPALITRRVPLADAAPAVSHDPAQIKTVVELE